MKLSAVMKRFASNVGVHIAKNYQHPPNTLMGLPKNRFATVIDVGANRGQFARTIMRHLPNANYYCFEPTPDAFEELQKWAHQRNNVIPINAAVGEDAGVISMNLHEKHTPSSSILDTTTHCHAVFSFTAQQSKVRVNVVTLDGYFSADPAKLRKEVLLKLDVQGYELPILIGAKNLLDDVRACIIEVCLDPLYQGQSRFEDIFDVLRRHQFQYVGNYEQLYGHDGHVISMDCVFLRPQ